MGLKRRKTSWSYIYEGVDKYCRDPELITKIIEDNGSGIPLVYAVVMPREALEHTESSYRRNEDKKTPLKAI